MSDQRNDFENSFKWLNVTDAQGSSHSKPSASFDNRRCGSLDFLEYYKNVCFLNLAPDFRKEFLGDNNKRNTFARLNVSALNPSWNTSTQSFSAHNPSLNDSFWRYFGMKAYNEINSFLNLSFYLKADNIPYVCVTKDDQELYTLYTLNQKMEEGQKTLTHHIKNLNNAFQKTNDIFKDYSNHPDDKNKTKNLNASKYKDHSRVIDDMSSVFSWLSHIHKGVKKELSLPEFSETNPNSKEKAIKEYLLMLEQKLKRILNNEITLVPGWFAHHQSHSKQKSINESFPISISFNISFENYNEKIINLMPLDVPKVSKSNFSVDENADDALKEKYNAEYKNREMTVDFIQWMEIHDRINKTTVLEGANFKNKHLWNDVINSILSDDTKTFESLRQALERGNFIFQPEILIFSNDPSMEHLYQAYKLAIKTITSNQDQKGLQVGLNNQKKDFYRNNVLQKMTQSSITDNLSNAPPETKQGDFNELMHQTLKDQPQQSYGWGQLKEQIIANNNQFDHFSLNPQQKLFSYHASGSLKSIQSQSDHVFCIALNGPPGTGKTTVLQSVIASEVVKCALSGHEPKIIFGASATHQAKTNIIGGFKYSEVHSKNAKGIFKRWVSLDDGKTCIDYGLELDKPNTYTDMLRIYQKKELKEQWNSNFEKSFNEPLTTETQKKALERVQSYFRLTKTPNASISEYTKGESKPLIMLNNTLFDWVQCLENAEKHVKAEHFELNDLQSHIQRHLDNIQKNIFSVDLEIASSCHDYILSLMNKSKKDIVNAFDPSMLSAVNQAIEVISQDIHQTQKQYDILKTQQAQSETNRSESIKNTLQILDQAGQASLAKINEAYPALKTKSSFEIPNFLNGIEDDIIRIIKQTCSKVTSSDNLLDARTQFIYGNIQKILTRKGTQWEALQIDESDTENLSLLIEVQTENENPEMITLDHQIQKMIAAKNFLQSILELKEVQIKITKVLDKIQRIENLCDNSPVTKQRIQECVIYLNGFSPFNKTNISVTKITDEITDILSSWVDNAYKATCFHLAARWQEGKFIEETQNLSISSDKPDREEKARLYKILARIHPIFVSTLHALSNRVEARNGNHTDSGIGFIDLLIVDEAGQVSSEVGAIGLVLSKTLIALGDNYQIKPVFNIEPKIDIQLFNATCDIKNKDGELIGSSPWNCHKSSFLRIAQKYTPWHPYKELERGLYLLEHNRCPIEIISICDQMIYKENLRYAITSYHAKDNTTPRYNPILFNKVQHTLEKTSLNMCRNRPLIYDGTGIDLAPLQIKYNSGASVSAGSRYNDDEAKQILTWISNNYDKLTEGDIPLNKRIAIITPFKRQAQRILELGRKGEGIINHPAMLSQRKELFSTEKQKDSNAPNLKLIIGTVHSLQGAEIPIVLFSNVYGNNDIGTIPFQDKNPDILNVGLSRAKTSFIMFINSVFASDIKTKTESMTGEILRQFDNL